MCQVRDGPGPNLEMAFRVVAVRERTDSSTGSLPRVTVNILDTDSVRQRPLMLFANAPVPRSSLEPYDIKPPSTVGAIVLTPAL